MGAARRAKDRGLLLEQKKVRYRSDPARFRQANEDWKRRNPERHAYLVRRSHLKNRYNMTPEQYGAILVEQGGRCALCEHVPTTKALSVDHDHRCCPGLRSCGRCVRGLVCATCNRLLGWFDKKREAVLAYTERA